MEYKLRDFDKNKDYLVEIKKYNGIGDLLSIGDFTEDVIREIFINYDGFLRFAIEMNNEIYEIKYFKEDEETLVIPTYDIDNDVVEFGNRKHTTLIKFCREFRVTKIIWYNK